jgi:CheY-like chemotaxis protein
MKSGGIINISAFNTLNPIINLNQQIGQFITIAIKDEGQGMDAHVADNCFTANFTTKKEGSGLGLHMVKHIINENDGFISFETNLNVGTTFYVYLPAIPTMVKNIVKEEKLIKGSGQRIILMDDNDIIRIVGSSLLKELGYNPICVSNTVDLLKHYTLAAESGKKIALAILDLTIPGEKGGIDALNKLLKIESSVKAILSSGYISKDIQKNYKDYGFIGLLLKPYNINQLSQIVYDCLLL